jgi:hypothetical protein
VAAAVLQAATADDAARLRSPLKLFCQSEILRLPPLVIKSPQVIAMPVTGVV